MPRLDEICMTIAQMTNETVLNMLAKKIDFSRVPLTKREINDEIEDCRKANFTLKDTAEVFLYLIDDDNTGRVSFGGIWDL